MIKEATINEFGRLHDKLLDADNIYLEYFIANHIAYNYKFYEKPLSYNHTMILYKLSSINRPISVIELSKLTSIDYKNITRYIDYLVGQDFIRKYKKQDNRRVTLIELTEKWKNINVARNDVATQIAYERFNSALTEEQLVELNAAQATYIKYMEMLKDAPVPYPESPYRIKDKTVTPMDSPVYLDLRFGKKS